MTTGWVPLAVSACAALALFGTGSGARGDEVRRPRITGLSHVALFVHDIEKSRAFYKDYLGFAEPYFLNDPDGNLHLTWIKINDRQTLELFPEKEMGSDRLNHIAIETDDAEALRAYLAGRGVAVPEKVQTVKIGNTAFMITDPDGHKVEVVQYQPAGKTAQMKGRFMPDARVSARMSHAGILVGDLEASLKFYRDVLGFRETWRGSKDGKALNWVNVAVPDGEDYIELMLYEKLPAPGQRGVQHHICLEAPDVEKAAEVLKSRPLPEGCKPPGEIRTGVNQKRQMNLFDPDGTRVELMEPTTVTGKPAPPSTAPAPRPIAADH